MRYQVVLVTGLVAASLHAPVVARGDGQALPVRDGRPIVALVNDAPVFLDELVMSAGSATDLAVLREGRGSTDDLDRLDRLVTIRLVAQEATTMGLADVPEIQMQVDVTSREILREVLIERLVKDVVADTQAVERLVREAVREWQTTSVLFQDEAAARRAQLEIAAGAPFADVAARAVAAGLAKVDSDSTYHASGDYLPAIATALAPLRTGEVSPVISLPAGFTVVKVLDIRYPDNPEARAEAEKQVLNEKQIEVLKAHEQEQRRQYVVIDRTVLDGIDYEADQPTLEALLKDDRVVATIEGADALTVADLTDYLQMQFFHGPDRESQRRRMNERKEDALDATLGRRLLNLEARRLGIDRTPAYVDRVTGYRESLLFESFVQKVIAPANKMTEDEVRDYYDDHLAEYAYPAMLRIRGLAFARRGDAESAMRTLREGADFGWLAANAEGRLPDETPGLLQFTGQPVTIDSMPPGLQNALEGVRSGDFRMYASPEGRYYVLGVQQLIESSPRPYADVRDEIARTLYAEKIQKDLESYADRLRAQSTVETYLVRK